ncbi:MAG: MBL fold metallo-hydrolase [Candidatus Komeilibacteria bacterium]|nr:MBL fold metallo-hydrolase [Candidatus Komeilibacteria bacterium]
MTIYYFGLTCFRVQDGGASLLFDPFPENQKAGLKLPRMQNDIILYSARPEEKVSKENSFVITTPGEYEISGVFVYGIPAGGEGADQKIIYLTEIEGVRIAHLGLIKDGKLSDKQLERLEGVDILMVPIGGNDSLNAKQAAEIINELEPRVVIPMNYQLPGIKTKLNTLEEFKKEMGGKFETVDKLKIGKKDLPEEETKFFILEQSS